MKQLVFYLSFIFIICSCSSNSPQKEIETAKAQDLESPHGSEKVQSESSKPSLTIEGNNIWVREAPITGNVVLKLNDGDVCSILEKGDKQFIRGIEDWWYKIEYRDTVGWVFGSQTSEKHSKETVPFEVFIEHFVKNYLIQNNLDSLIGLKDSSVSKFVHADIGTISFENPGAYCGPLGNMKYAVNYPRMQFGKAFLQNLKFHKDKLPTDGFCEPSTLPDGIYFAKRTDELPKYYDMVNDSCCINIELPKKFHDAPLMRTLVLTEGYIVKDLTFVGVNGQWYIYLIYNCDCSA